MFVMAQCKTYEKKRSEEGKDMNGGDLFEKINTLLSSCNCRV
jgi:hypothetical protein